MSIWLNRAERVGIVSAIVITIAVDQHSNGNKREKEVVTEVVTYRRA